MGHVHQLEFAFLGSPGHLTALANVFIAAPRRLHHLVVGTRFSINETVAEPHGGIVNDLGLLVGEEIFVATVRRDKTPILGRTGRMARRRRMRGIGRLRPMGHISFAVSHILIEWFTLSWVSAAPHVRPDRFQQPLQMSFNSRRIR